MFRLDSSVPQLRPAARPATTPLVARCLGAVADERRDGSRAVSSGHHRAPTLWLEPVAATARPQGPPRVLRRPSKLVGASGKAGAARRQNTHRTRDTLRARREGSRRHLRHGLLLGCRARVSARAGRACHLRRAHGLRERRVRCDVERTAWLAGVPAVMRPRRLVGRAWPRPVGALGSLARELMDVCARH